MGRLKWTAAVLLLTAAIAADVRAAEPWADTDLPERDGLLVWLDASR